jgi:GNAT superfamily N-acetyltransferase
MQPYKLRFTPVDWPAAQRECLAFRQDAWLVSFGNLDGFSEAKTLAWFDYLSLKHAQTFVHVWHAETLIGQIEYRAPLVTNDGVLGAYINLFYLLPRYRGNGLGHMLHEYVLSDLRLNRCQSASLRVIKGNSHAENFYAKHGWQAVGLADDTGAQLMTLSV